MEKVGILELRGTGETAGYSGLDLDLLDLLGDIRRLEVARHAVGFGERLVVALRAKLLPAMLEQIGRRDRSYALEGSCVVPLDVGGF